MKKLEISQVDALFSNGSYPIEFLFYYRNAFDTKRMRRALRGLSVSFWPLFGVYRDGLISFEAYRDEDFIDEVSVDQEFALSEKEELEFDIYSRFRLPELEKLFFIKMIRLRNGLAVIPKMNHLAGDGYSYFYFLSLLAASCQPSLVPFKSPLLKSFFKPHHRRTILKEFSFHGMSLPSLPQMKSLTLRQETIPRKDIQSVIREAGASADLKISTNDVLAALALKSLVGARSKVWGEMVTLTIPIDVRRYIGEYGRGFFGNSIMLHSLPLERGRIERSAVRDIAVEIRKSMPRISKEIYIGYLTGLEKIITDGRWDQFKPFDPNSGCLVTNLSRLPVDKLDFGTGRPDLILPLTAERNSAGILADEENFILRFAY